jgi:retron-type reverse transcriptase
MALAMVYAITGLGFLTGAGGWKAALKGPTAPFMAWGGAVGGILTILGGAGYLAGLRHFHRIIAAGLVLIGGMFTLGIFAGGTGLLRYWLTGFFFYMAYKYWRYGGAMAMAAKMSRNAGRPAGGANSWTSTAPSTASKSPVPSPAGKSAPRPAPSAGQSLGHLDTGAFAPLSDEDIKRRLKRIGTGGSWFQMLGMRGRIPPVSDERTLLIDRALVAHGLLSPEDLKEIHEVGEEYERLKPSLLTQQRGRERAASQALADDTAARKALQEQKKAESAARKEARAKAIEERKATDIIFLGRGVSGGLADRRANVEKLAAFSLPVLTSPADIATALGLPIHRLRWLAFHSEASPVSHYVRFTVPKKSGGTRELAAPHHDTAAAQMWILVNILEKVPVRESAHGFVKGRSIMSNAVPHVRRDAVVNVDLKDFFPTITFPRVRGIFEGLGYSPAAATVLALLCTDSPRRTVEYDGKTLHVATGPRALPQGACTSPALSNLAARKLDARLNGLARKTGWTYTRYADDLTFSANGETAKQCGGLLTALRRFCAEEGFTVNEKKTRVQRQNTQQTVTGIVINRRPNVPRDLYRRLRAILHNARKTGLAAQNTENHPRFVMWVQGMIAWISMANPDRGRVLRTAFDKVKSVT